MKKVVLAYSGAVSYTHLDVYKRQQYALSFSLGDAVITIGGMAKGSGMIHPNMATMLSFITTDAAVEKQFLQDCLRQAVEQTFNMISVDGDTSTNDMVLAFANGMAGNVVLQKATPGADVFQLSLIHI